MGVVVWKHCNIVIDRLESRAILVPPLVRSLSSSAEKLVLCIYKVKRFSTANWSQSRMFCASRGTSSRAPLPAKGAEATIAKKLAGCRLASLQSQPSNCHVVLSRWRVTARQRWVEGGDLCAGIYDIWTSYILIISLWFEGFVEGSLGEGKVVLFVAISRGWLAFRCYGATEAWFLWEASIMSWLLEMGMKPNRAFASGCSSRTPIQPVRASGYISLAYRLRSSHVLHCQTPHRMLKDC